MTNIKKRMAALPPYDLSRQIEATELYFYHGNEVPSGVLKIKKILITNMNIMKAP